LENFFETRSIPRKSPRKVREIGFEIANSVILIRLKSTGHERNGINLAKQNRRWNARIRFMRIETALRRMPGFGQVMNKKKSSRMRTVIV
jgi:hypothetical protein